MTVIACKDCRFFNAFDWLTDARAGPGLCRIVLPPIAAKRYPADGMGNWTHASSGCDLGQRKSEDTN